jgi:hypothetical protein
LRDEVLGRGAFLGGRAVDLDETCKQVSWIHLTNPINSVMLSLQIGWLTGLLAKNLDERGL